MQSQLSIKVKMADKWINPGLESKESSLITYLLKKKLIITSLEMYPHNKTRFLPDNSSKSSKDLANAHTINLRCK
jgi:hypothetical protein